MSTMTPMKAQIVRDAPFARRLEQACEANTTCPPLHKGRLTWIADQLKKRGDRVSVQTVARWMNGEAKPRQAKNTKLAQLLGVDPVWLYMGVQPNDGATNTKNADAVVLAAECLLELHESRNPAGSDSPIAVQLRQAIQNYRMAA